jgi:hypothetical protein
MKIPESIIEKYQLNPSHAQTGESFIYNQLLYKSSLPDYEQITIMECDLTGKPAKEICFYNKATKFWGAVTPEFLIDTPTQDALKILRQ